MRMGHTSSAQFGPGSPRASYWMPGEEKYQTPGPVIDWMIELIPDGVKTVLEPTPGKGYMVKKLTEVGYNVTATPHFEELHPQSRFDAVVMNPPFFKGVENKMLLQCMEMAPIVIALVPWYTLINSEPRTKKLRDFGLRSITHLPRRIFSGIRVQTCILQLDRSYADPQPIILFYDGPSK